MKKLLSIVTVAAIICSLSLAQALAVESTSGEGKSDRTMMDDGMKKDGGMVKDDKMAAGAMKKDGMMHDDGMRQNKGMMQDGMKTK